MLPLAVPGGFEIVIIVLLFLLPVLLVVFVALLVRDLFGGKQSEESRIDALEAEVRDLQDELAAREDEEETE